MAQNPIRHRYYDWLATSGGTWFDRLLVPVLLLLMILFTGSRLLVGDWALVAASLPGIVLMVLIAGVGVVQRILLRQPFTRSHAFYVTVFWAYCLLWLTVYRALAATPAVGKESQPFYIFALLFAAISLRVLLSLFGLTPLGYRLFMSKIPLWEQVLVAINEFVAAGLFSFILGNELSRIVQPNVFTLRIEPVYSIGLLALSWLYYLLMHVMWFQRGNQWLSRNTVWVRLARILAPLALVMASLLIVRHFTILSEPRSANLLNTADLNQTILALSPILWMMIFFVLLLVYTGAGGLRRRLLPPRLLDELPGGIAALLRTVSDMDILLIFGLFATAIPLQLVLFSDVAPLGDLQQQLAQQNALIDSTEQALAFIFALPFYLLTLLLLVIYAYVLAKPTLSASDRDALVNRLPITLLVMFIITLYLCAIPFSQVLTSGRIPNLRQDLGYILAFDVLIPLILLYFHYFVLVRLPYGRGQSRWRTQHGRYLETELRRIDKRLQQLQDRIKEAEWRWNNQHGLETNDRQRIDMLYFLVTLNSERDRLNMERLRLVGDRQELAEVSEAPVSLTVARLPARAFGLGIPLVLAFKIYEWAIVNDGLRQVAENPNIGVIEFFQTILENTNF